MKKVISYLFFVILLCFFIPIIFTNKRNGIDTISLNTLENVLVAEEKEQSNENGDNDENNQNRENEGNYQRENNGTMVDEVSLENYDYKEYNTIKLFHTETGEIEELNLDEYLCGVVSAEMPASYEIEALKAQAVVARSYTLYKMINSKPHGEDISICDSYQCCQAWISKEERFEKWEDNSENENWNKIVTAVNETKGKVITYDGKIINAFFHANSGGKTEIPINVWGGSDYPYLQVVETSGEEGYTQYSSEVELTIEELISKFKEKYNDIVVDVDKVMGENGVEQSVEQLDGALVENVEQPSLEENEEIKVLEYTESGRVKTLKIGNKTIAGTEVRTILFLKSTNFDIEIDKENNKIKFKVIGYGHGIGMSQTGADAMAKQGRNYEQIIKHFYVGVEIIDI